MSCPKGCNYEIASTCVLTSAPEHIADQLDVECIECGRALLNGKHESFMPTIDIAYSYNEDSMILWPK